MAQGKKKKTNSIGHGMQNMSLSRSKELLAAMPNASRKSTSWKNKKQINKLISENHQIRENSSCRWSEFRELGLLPERVAR